MATLMRVDRNGTKYYKGMIECDRCGGAGIYYIGVHNGKPLPSWVDGGVCFKCGGEGKVEGEWKEYTPEYEAKLEARRAKRAEEQARIWAEEQAKIEAERKAKEEAERIAQEEEERRIREQKAKSQYFGQIGDKIDTTATYIKTAWFTIPSFYGFGKEDTMYIHTFKIGDNTVIWKTSTDNMGNFDENGEWVRFEEGKQIHLKGTIKDHSEYKDEKQTVLTRCKVQG